ncbi:MAG: hypothetical protein HC853_07945 [Anaerolineae bacterium]|nr:hypothetical protein [Anaerolineae bacterium]
MCAAWVQQGHLQAAVQALSRFPVQRFAPTEQGIAHAAEKLNTTASALLKQLRFTSERFTALRTALEIVSETQAMLAATAQNATTSFGAVEYELFVPRQHRKRAFFLHGKLVLQKGDEARVFYLFNDRGDATALQWLPTFKYLSRWAKRSAAHVAFPTTLIITTRPFRVRAMLRMVQLAKGDSRLPQVFATCHRTAAMAQGLLDSAVQWFAMNAHSAVAEASPLALPPVAHQALARSVHAVGNRDAVRPHRKHPRTQPISFLPKPSAGLERFEALPDLDYRALGFLARNPACPESTIRALLNLDEAASHQCLEALLESGFATGSAEGSPQLWSATDEAMRLYIARTMQDDGVLGRYRFYRADHLRRPVHTATAYRFFEALHLHSQARSKAIRKLDTKPGTVNDGVIPYFALEHVESEYIASDWYVMLGNLRRWRPDGYGAFRAGVRWTRFWLEIDGTHQAPSRNDPQVWEQKCNQLCDYALTQRWTFRYATQPRLLVVSTSLSNGTLIYDAVHYAARARAMQVPLVFVASSAALEQRGPLAPIWLNISTDKADGKFCHAFEGLEMPVRTLPRPDPIGALQHAYAMDMLPKLTDMTSW